MVKLLLTGYTDTSALIEAINCGLVYRYLTKPWHNDDLRLTVTRALEHYEMMKSQHRLGMENQRLRALLDEIGELTTDGMATITAEPQTANAGLDLPQAEEVYELLG
jgi:DNA-binding NtrC family response regulator